MSILVLNLDKNSHFFAQKKSASTGTLFSRKYIIKKKSLLRNRKWLSFGQNAGNGAFSGAIFGLVNDLKHACVAPKQLRPFQSKVKRFLHNLEHKYNSHLFIPGSQGSLKRLWSVFDPTDIKFSVC